MLSEADATLAARTLCGDHPAAAILAFESANGATEDRRVRSRRALRALYLRPPLLEPSHALDAMTERFHYALAAAMQSSRPKERTRLGRLLKAVTEEAERLAADRRAA